MSTTTNDVEAGDDAPARRPKARPAIVAAIVIIAALCAPIAAGFRYEPLPLALWSIGAKPIVAGTTGYGSKSRTVTAGEVIDCGFFRLYKQKSVDWKALQAASR